MECNYPSLDEKSLHRLGEKLARYVAPGVVFCLSGTLGAGKTSLARAIIKSACKITEEIPSPTFTLVQSYEFKGNCEIWHLDLYRLETCEEVLALGLEDAFIDHCCIIEWPDIISDMLPADVIYIHLDFACSNIKQTDASILQDSRRVRIKTSNQKIKSIQI
ncbi:tRNA (adenosine(37)-N6)-threonylcarbamoyltransferase complex ATPase subunit type 1 TsaE [Alphaproteobacteria bacterium]|nr:tRNA (adenosine(37)-N6)-threonylcarbamoyltransferase complex ATPase subunit type 1 TsaE [Alphaproteobacteria bacterium]MDA9815922.1 tRNA (adenosine(37)-N6)-threonylcarbamoyltransferase complex ATPase subunit type 1 TsaE [Alphaproteobacteria bacterium]